ncbi:uncharacterized protein LOC116849419 isoform X2 [Odontomachus brunneus]|uniref:uncharacterized protein LOC116849419 isoform X2 n=1 Tax=Odontomachus brunneus TaxID=486640 RepID=UPI0013F1CEA8|nr:uncharacterized protein LOC116849419 isoform X2 [Odontomachus brunneus]
MGYSALVSGGSSESIIYGRISSTVGDPARARCFMCRTRPPEFYYSAMTLPVAALSCLYWNCYCVICEYPKYVGFEASETTVVTPGVS